MPHNGLDHLYIRLRLAKPAAKCVPYMMARKIGDHYRLSAGTDCLSLPFPSPSFLHPERFELSQDFSYRHLRPACIPFHHGCSSTGDGSRTHKPKSLASKASLCSIRVRPRGRREIRTLILKGAVLEAAVYTIPPCARVHPERFELSIPLTGPGA